MLGRIQQFARHTGWASQLRSFSKAPRAPLPAGIPTAAAVRPPRSLIAVYGYDSHKFLNGLITIRPPEPTGSEPPGAGVGAFAAMLNAKGRIISDLFVYPAHDNAGIQQATGAGGDSCYVLEVDATMADKVQEILDFHVLMMDVKLKELDGAYTAWSVWNDEAPVDTAQFGADLWTEDRRAPGFGVRVVRPVDRAPAGVPEASVDEYRLRRYLFGIPEGSEELIPSKALPLDSCIDYMGGIDFHKGCYLGQELTIRTHHHGNVRKRILPVVFTTTADEELSDELYRPVDMGVAPDSPIQDSSPIPNAGSLEPAFASSPFAKSPFDKPSSPIMPGDPALSRPQRPSGSVIASIGNVGLAKMRVDTLGHAFRLSDLYVKPMIPFWWPQQ